MMSWGDVFPWLLDAQRDSTLDRAASSPIDLSERPDGHLRPLLDHIRTRLLNWTLAEIFPHAPRATPISHLGLSNRSFNALTRNHVDDLSELLPLYLSDVMDWRNVGRIVVDDIVISLIRVSIAEPREYDGLATDDLGQGAPTIQEAITPSWMNDVLEDVDILVQWNTLIGRCEEPMFELSSYAPASVVQARQRILNLTSNTAGEGQDHPTLLNLLDDLFSGYGDREVDLIVNRLLSEEPDTLEALGERHGVTRERIRQVEARVLRSLREAIDGEPFLSLLASIHGMIGTVSTFTELSNRIPAITEEVEPLGVPAWHVLSVLDPAFETDGNWCARPTLAAAKERTAEEIAELANPYGVVEISDLTLIEAGSPEAEHSLHRQWLRHLGYITTRDHVFTATGSVNDYAAGILSIEGEPLSSDEIVERFAFERSVRSLRNALSLDERFDRVDRDHWALAEWNLETYTTIKDLIEKEVDAAGGSMPLNDLIDRITTRFSVSANSVVAYANVPPFRITKGMVRLRDTDYVPSTTPATTPRFYRRGSAWLHRVKVNHDHLRGSGTIAPSAMARLLEMEFGASRTMPSRLGEQSFYWTGAQPSYGTIRRFLEDLEAQVGDEVFLIFSDDGTFDVETVADSNGDPLHDSLALIGAPRSLSPEVASLVFAAAIESDYDGSFETLHKRYKRRGDSEVAELLNHLI